MSNREPRMKEHTEIIESEEKSLSELVRLTKKPCESVSSDQLSEEGHLLEWFGKHYNSERKFSQHKNRKYFFEIFENILKLRLADSKWMGQKTHEVVSRYLIVLRIMMRDSNFQRRFMEHDGVKPLSEQYEDAARKYLVYGEESFLIDALSNLSSIFQKLASVPNFRENLVSNRVHENSVTLLHSSETFILHCALHILIDLSEYSKVKEIAADHQATEILVRIIQEYDSHSRVKAADLLRILCSNHKICEQLVIYDCLPILLSVLHDGNQCILLWHIVWVLVQLCRDIQHASEIRLLGGIPLLLNLLNDDRSLIFERHEISSANMRSGRTPHMFSSAVGGSPTAASNDMLFENILKLKTACCTALSELGLDDHNTETIVEANGVFIIAKLILPQEVPEKCKPVALKLQRNAFRALRFLFSMERNRRLFKRLFPVEMFQAFIDIGHYVREYEKYTPLVNLLNAMSLEGIEKVKENIEELNQNKTPRRFIKKEYAVMDLLGSGAFGSVYKVKKDNEEKPLALKEVSAFVGGKEPKTGKSKKKRQLDEIVHELNIIREQLRHPNVVRYYRTFEENDKLYIEMELIEGASLQEHFTSLKEKEENGMGEVRIWRVLIQLCLALRYLHKEKHIVHRDLTPGNIMLGENDHVTITDFGLAKQKQNESKLYSVVGTLLYSCPEIIKSEPYGEKADIWALGCILYQMATLSPPFPSDNMLSLAKKIVEAKFEPVPDQEEYSSLINETVTKCLTVEPEERPDIIGVVSLIAAPMLKYTDRMTALYHVTERRLEKERRRTQRNYHEARRNMRNYQSLFQASQENTNRISRNFSTSNIHTFTQQEKVSSFNPTVSSPALFKPTTPPNGHKVSPGDATSPGSDVFSDASSSGSSSYQESLSSDLKLNPRPPRRLHLSKVDDASKASIPCRALSFEMTEQAVARDALLSRVGTASKGRPGSASNAGMLTISPRKVRQITDPVQTILHQLHKIIFIDQLPPTKEVNFRRRVISRYKRALFSPQSSSINLKNELKKLLSGSGENIDACSIVDTSSLARQATAEAAAKELAGNQNGITLHGTQNGVTSLNSSPSAINEEGITYSQMYSMIEMVLCESGYYDVTQASKQHQESFKINRYVN